MKEGKIMKNRKKSELNEWWWLCLMAGVIIIGIAAASGRNGNRTAEIPIKGNSDTSTAISASGTEKSKIYNIGDSVRLKTYIITVNKIRTSEGTKYDKPNAGYEFFYINCTIENISDETQTISSLAMFQVRNKNGLMYEQALAVNGNGQLDGNLLPGKKMTGDYVAEIPKGEKGLNLIFDSCFSEDEKITVNLN